MSVNLKLLRERYVDGKTYKAGTPTGIFKHSGVHKKLLLEAICSQCGTRFWSQAYGFEKRSSCGCLRGQKRNPDGMMKRSPNGSRKVRKYVVTKEDIEAKWKGMRRNNWLFLCVDHQDPKTKIWKVSVRCEICGNEFVTTLNAFFKRSRQDCTCKAMQKDRAYLEKVAIKEGAKRSHLEMIWPSVIAAGRQAMEKYQYAMANV